MTRCGSARRHPSICAALRPSPPAVSPLAGNDPRLRLRPEDSRPSRSPSRTSLKASFSPFVLDRFDSESGDADPPGASLAVSYRPAGDQSDRAFHSCAGTVRTLPPPAWPLRRPARRRWGVVGPGRAGLARRSRPAIATAAGVRTAGAYSNHAQTGLSGDCAPQSRSDLQRTGLAKPRGALPTLPHDPRRCRASPAPLVERVPSACARGPLLRPLPLTCGWRLMSPSDRRHLVIEARTCGTSGTCSPKRAGGHSALHRRSGEWLRGEDAYAPSFLSLGGHDDRSLAGPQDDRDGTTAARR